MTQASRAAEVVAARDRQRKLVAEGKCQACGKPRGRSTSRVYCAVCAAKRSALTRAWQARRKAAALCQRCGRSTAGRTVTRRDAKGRKRQRRPVYCARCSEAQALVKVEARLARKLDNSALDFGERLPDTIG